MKKTTMLTTAAILAVMPLFAFAQPTGGAGLGAIKTPAPKPGTPAAPSAPAKVDDKTHDAMKTKMGGPTSVESTLENTARAITYKDKDKKEVTRYFEFHKNAESKLVLVEFTKLDGEEKKSDPEALDWVLKNIGVAQGAKGESVTGPDGKIYRVPPGWTSADSDELDSHNNEGPHGEKLIDLDSYEKHGDAWKKHGAKPKQDDKKHDDKKHDGKDHGAGVAPATTKAPM